MKITLKELLKGYELGKPQAVGNMRVVPILTETPFVKVTGVESIRIAKDRSYETLELSNGSEFIGIVPQGLMYITEEHAQDRTVNSMHLIKKRKSVDADCIQPSQGGLMRGDTERSYGILPHSLRLEALRNREDGDYTTLWNSVSNYLRDSGLSGNALLQFFKDYKEELDTFVAQFEVVPNQVGAVFVINDVILGIEILPNYEMWNHLWRPLVRDCYGTELIKINKVDGIHDIFKSNIKMDEVESFEELELELNRVEGQEKTYVDELVAEFLDDDFEVSEDESIEDFELSRVTSDKFDGQVVSHGGKKFICVSLMSELVQKVKRAKKAKKISSRMSGENPYESDTEFRLNR